MLEVAASILLLGLTSYVLASARLLWQQGSRVVADGDDEDRFVPVDGANASWRAISDEVDERWAPAVYDSVVMPDDEVDDGRIDSARFRPVAAILARDAGSDSASS